MDRARELHIANVWCSPMKRWCTSAISELASIHRITHEEVRSVCYRQQQDSGRVKCKTQSFGNVAAAFSVASSAKIFVLMQWSLLLNISHKGTHNGFVVCWGISSKGGLHANNKWKGQSTLGKSQEPHLSTNCGRNPLTDMSPFPPAGYSSFLPHPLHNLKVSWMRPTRKDPPVISPKHQKMLPWFF